MSKASFTRYQREQRIRTLEAARPIDDVARYRKELEHNLKKAARGDIQAHFWLGIAHSGLEEKRYFMLKHDISLALHHLRIAAAGGHGDALLHLARICTRGGKATPQHEMDKALELTVQAAEHLSHQAWHVLEKYYLRGGNLPELLRDHTTVVGEPDDHGLAHDLIKQYRLTHPVARSVALPESGEAFHPWSTKRFRLDRTVWFPVNNVPYRHGVYERKHGLKVVYSHWNGKQWMGNAQALEELADDMASGWLGRASQQRLPWRALAHDPASVYTLLADPPGPLLPGVEMGGYVEHYEQGLPTVREIHVAKSVLSKDGDFLTMCGYMARKGSTLRQWCATLQIKVVDGYQPTICPVCARRTFQLPTAVPQ